MKILCFIDSIGSGGAQRQLVELAKEFKNKGNKVEFLVYHHEPFYLPELESNDIPYHYLPSKNYLNRILIIRKFIRKNNYDAVISFLEGANFIAELASIPFRKWKLIVGERSANPNILSSFKLRIYRYFHFLSDYVVSNSYENINIIRKANPFLSNKKLKVIYNLINKNKWEIDKTYIPFKNDKLNLIVVASHQYLKNGKNLVEAVNKLDSIHRSKLKIEWYGDISPDNSYTEMNNLIKLYALEDVFTFYKATNNIANKIVEADILGLFSIYEGLPNVICESMILGKPFIASNISDVPFLIEPHKNLLFNPLDSDEIKRVLEDCINCNEKDLIKVGLDNKEKACAIFDKEKIIQEYLNILN